MKAMFNNFYYLYHSSLLVKLLVLAIAVGSGGLFVTGKALFVSEDPSIQHGEFEYIEKTKGSRGAAPKYYVRDRKGSSVAMKYLASDCFSQLDLEKQFDLGFVNLYGENIVVFCSQDHVLLKHSEGLASVNQIIQFRKRFAELFSALLLLSVGCLFFLLSKKPKQ